MNLSNLHPAAGSKHSDAFRVGPWTWLRKWQNSRQRTERTEIPRSGGKVRVGFEGGQMPLYRRIPEKRIHLHQLQKDYRNQCIRAGEI